LVDCQFSHRVVAPVLGPDPSTQNSNEGMPRASMSCRPRSVRPWAVSTGHTYFMNTMPPVGALGNPLWDPLLINCDASGTQWHTHTHHTHTVTAKAST
jgi:hypothetical protein